MASLKDVFNKAAAGGLSAYSHPTPREKFFASIGDQATGISPTLNEVANAAPETITEDIVDNGPSAEDERPDSEFNREGLDAFLQNMTKAGF